jgi:phage terminase large subunit GpA-like protein
MYKLIKGFLEGLRPEPLLSVSTWSDEHRYLSTEASAEPGRWRTDRTPYLREILDKLSTLDVTEEVIVMKGAQLGFTEAGFNFVGYVMDIAPGPILYVLPTVEVSKRNSKTRLDPMIEATPRLKAKIAPAKSRDSGNTTLMKEFPGGALVIDRKSVV